MTMNKIIEKDINEILESNIIDWDKFRNTNVLITGANGMLPSYLVFTLLELNKRGMNVHVYALVRNRQKAELVFKDFLFDTHLHLLVQDVSDPISIDVPFKYIIHAASQASPKYYGIDPVGTIRANVLGTINTLELAKEHHSKGYLYFSSGEVYGIVSPEKFPFKECDYGYLDILNVRNCYAESKRMGESLCVSYHRQYNIPAKIVRIFHTYGPSMTMNDGRVFGDFCKNIVNGEDIVMNSDGSAVRLFCYVTDAIVAYLKVLLDGDDAQAYNVANLKGESSIYELAQTLVALYPKKKLKVVRNLNSQTEASKMKSSLVKAIPDCSKITSLGWNPTISIKEGFRRTIESLENNKNNNESI